MPLLNRHHGITITVSVGGVGVGVADAVSVSVGVLVSVMSVSVGVSNQGTEGVSEGRIEVGEGVRVAQGGT
jgi:hypothetical protein